MPLVPNFSATESLAFNEIITLTDISTGSDGTIVNRRVYLITAENTYLTLSGVSTTPAYIDWTYSNASISLNVLAQSTAVNVVVEWWSTIAKVYEKERLYCFNLFDFVFAYGLLGTQTSNPGIIQDTNYFSNFMQFIVNLWNSENSVLYGDDIYSSQGALNRNQNFIVNENNYF